MPNHTVIIDASATNLEEDGTRTGNFNFLHYFLSYRLSVSQSVLSVSQVSLSLCQFASVLIDFVVDSILINFRATCRNCVPVPLPVSVFLLLCFFVSYVLPFFYC